MLLVHLNAFQLPYVQYSHNKSNMEYLVIHFATNIKQIRVIKKKRNFVEFYQLLIFEGVEEVASQPDKIVLFLLCIVGSQGFLQLGVKI